MTTTEVKKCGDLIDTTKNRFEQSKSPAAGLLWPQKRVRAAIKECFSTWHQCVRSINGARRQNARTSITNNRPRKKGMMYYKAFQKYNELVGEFNSDTRGMEMMIHKSATAGSQQDETENPKPCPGGYTFFNETCTRTEEFLYHMIGGCGCQHGLWHLQGPRTLILASHIEFTEMKGIQYQGLLSGRTN